MRVKEGPKQTVGWWIGKAAVDRVHPQDKLQHMLVAETLYALLATCF